MEWIAFKAILSLIFVILLMGIVLYLMKKYLFGKTTMATFSGIDMQVIGILSLHPKKTIHVIKILNKYFIVGVTEQSIHLISEISDDESIRLLTNFEQTQYRSSKHFAEYFTEYLGFIGWKSGKRGTQHVVGSHDNIN